MDIFPVFPLVPDARNPQTCQVLLFQFYTLGIECLVSFLRIFGVGVALAGMHRKQFCLPLNDRESGGWNMRDKRVYRFRLFCMEERFSRKLRNLLTRVLNNGRLRALKNCLILGCKRSMRESTISSDTRISSK
mgnify:CR=1 FL=1